MPAAGLRVGTMTEGPRDPVLAQGLAHARGID